MVTTSLAYFLSELVIEQSNQSKKTVDMLEARIVMHSVVDYTKYGLANRWCFTPDWLQEPKKCGLDHKRATERLIMNSNTEAFIRGMIADKSYTGAYGTPLRLEFFEQVISVSDFTPSHPLYRILNSLGQSDVKYIKIHVSRDKRAVLPQSGNEVYINIKVQLLDKNSKLLQVAGSTLEVRADIGIFPREVGTFALMVPNHLHLDKKAGVSVGKGDHIIPVFDSRNLTLGYNNIVFDSPVFVNGDINLPTRPDGENDATDSQYNPVVFNDRVYVAGNIKRDGKLYTQASTRGLTNQWIHNRQFGGFLRGVVREGGRDKGLDVLADLIGAGSIELADVNQCIQRNYFRGNIRATELSKLTQKTSTTSDSARIKLYLTDNNRFSPQRTWWNNPSDPSGSDIDRPWSSNTQNIDADYDSGINPDRTVLSYDLEFVDPSNNRVLKVSEKMGDNGATLELSMKFTYNSFKKSVQDQEKDIYNQKMKIDGITYIRSDVVSDLDDAKKKLSEIDGKIDSSKKKIADWTEDLKSASGSEEDELKEDIADEKVVLKGLEDSRPPVVAEVDKWQDILDQLDSKIKTELATFKERSELLKKLDEIYYKNDYPRLTLKVENFDSSTSNPSFRNLSFKFKHPFAFITDDGKPLSLKVKMNMYDLAYFGDYNARNNTPYEDLAKFQTTIYPLGSGVKIDPVKGTDGKNLAVIPGTADENFNIDEYCDKLSNGYSSSGGVDWNVDFSPKSKHSWSFTHAYDTRPNFIMDVNNASLVEKTAAFHIRASARDCVVENTADFVAGFFVCDNFIIAPRDKSLRIIGTVIAKNIEIDPSVAKNGLRWSSIYHPQSVFELRKVGILSTATKTKQCDEIKTPIWHPFPSMADAADIAKCSPNVLRARAQPFQWTSVDPDCGLVNGSAETKCKNRLINFHVVEFSREAGL
ncbi:MAG: hypothetical protein ACLGGX_12225 [Bdellovibrionia bacterium]